MAPPTDEPETVVAETVPPTETAPAAEPVAVEAEAEAPGEVSVEPIVDSGGPGNAAGAEAVVAAAPATPETGTDEPDRLQATVAQLRAGLEGHSRGWVEASLALLALLWLLTATWSLLDAPDLRWGVAAVGAVLAFFCLPGLLLYRNLHIGPREAGFSPLPAMAGMLLGLLMVGVAGLVEQPGFAGAGVMFGGLGAALLLRSLGLTPHELRHYCAALAVGSGGIVLMVPLAPDQPWALLPFLLLLGLGLAGMHHRRFQLVGWYLGCYLVGVGALGALVDRQVAVGALIGGGLPLAGSGSLFLIRRYDRDARQQLCRRGERLLAAGKPAEALREFNRAMEGAQREGALFHDAELWAGKARALAAHRHHDRALTHYAMALEAAPQDEHMWFEKGELYRHLGQYAAAASCFERATELEFPFTDGWLALAQMRERLRELEPAEVAYRNALTLGADAATAQLGLGRTLAGLGRVREALKVLDQAVALAPDNPAPYMARGDIYYSLQDWERADQRGYSRAVRLKPGLTRAWRQLARVYRAQEKPEMVVMALSRLLEHEPDDLPARWQRAELHYHANDFGEAMADLHAIIASDPGHRKARQFKALILEKLDDKGWH